MLLSFSTFRQGELRTYRSGFLAVWLSAEKFRIWLEFLYGQKLKRLWIETKAQGLLIESTPP